ncbi:unnamed protein product, partial [Rhizoctonia solani]
TSVLVLARTASVLHPAAPLQDAQVLFIATLARVIAIVANAIVVITRWRDALASKDRLSLFSVAGS